jgi:hypothetical protein
MIAFKAEAHLNNIKEFTPYLKENATLHNYKNQLVNAVYRHNHCLQMSHIVITSAANCTAYTISL